MPLTPGFRLGPYEILSPLGAGGMGEVYRAKDTRLGRDVAVKVLPQHLSEQPEIRARFEREAKTVSSLNHPNICVLFDVGREGDIDYLVMELVEGDTLEARLARGSIPSAEALRLGAQIADALDRAHRAGVIHRDLKPGNVMLTRGGAKLMDFGLARATGMAGPAGASGATMAMLTQSPSMAKALTAEGTILGTFQYMAPEQLEGKEADARSDIWALGCVLYEMFTGRRAFEGRSQASLIAAILEREPAPVGEPPSGAGGAGGASVAGSAPPHGIERLIRNCLAKDPDERIQTAHDVKLQLLGIAEGAGVALGSTASASSVAGVAAARAASSRSAGRERLAWALVAAGLVLAAGIFAWLYPLAHSSRPEFRFRVGAIPGTVQSTWPRISPDGRFLLLLAVDSLGVNRAYTRRLDEIDAHPVPGTEGLARPYWSPDGREIAFVANDKLQRVPIAGGSPTVVCAALGGYDLSWGSRGQILVDRSAVDSLRVVPAGGGELRPATRIDRAAGETGSAWPCFLPDGEHFLFIGIQASGAGDIRLGRIGSLDSKLLGKSDGRVEYAPGDWVLFLRGATLLAQKLDLAAGKLTGQPITLVDEVRVGGAQGNFSVSQNGILTYALDDGGGALSIQAADRTGALENKALVTGVVTAPDLSPDGRKLLYVRGGSTASETGEVYVLDLDRSTDTRLTFTGGAAFTPHWSPDGRRFAFVTRGAAGNDRIRIGSADGLGAPDSIAVPTGSGAALWQWTRDGSRFVYQTGANTSFVVNADGPERTPRALVDSTSAFWHPDISPDGRWVAGTAGTFPGTQVFVQSLVGPPGRWQISSAPASRPRWTKGGRELVFESRDNRMMAVDIDTRDGFHAGTPRPLFPLPVGALTVNVMTWTCDTNGERFYLVVPARTGNAGNIEVVSGFHSLVSRK